MASAAKEEWVGAATARLDELERLHVSAFGTNRGRRWGTEQFNRSLFLALAAQFQTYCRDLHDEAVRVHVAHASIGQASMLQQLLTHRRRLDTGNPRTDALDQDFSRLGFRFLDGLRSDGSRTATQLTLVDTLIDFRNLVSHGQEGSIDAFVRTNDIAPTLKSYRKFRRAISALVGTMDRVVAAELETRLQIPAPW